MNKCYFTNHASDRVNNRLGGLVTAAEVEAAVLNNPGREYVDVKYFSKRMYLGDPTDPETPKGDKITARVDTSRGAIVTVMLRKSTSQSERYNS